jgi:hypothetical protein
VTEAAVQIHEKHVKIYAKSLKLRPGALEAATGAAVGSRSAILELPGNMAGPFFPEKLDFGVPLGFQMGTEGVRKSYFFAQ